jgi:hypothetical protein
MLHATGGCLEERLVRSGSCLLFAVFWVYTGRVKDTLMYTENVTQSQI